MASSTYLVASPTQTLILGNHTSLSPPKPTTLSLQLPPLSSAFASKSKKSGVFAAASPVLNDPPTNLSNESNPTHSSLTGSTRTITTVFALALAVSKVLASKLCSCVLNLKGQIVQQNLISTVSPMFFAALKDRPTGYLNTPLTVVAAGMAKWLDIYSGVLMVRVLLSWFPNIPWDRQPLSAIRDLCDPYLNLFRNIIPPIFDTLDVSPLLAFAVLGTLGSILNSSRGAY